MSVYTSPVDVSMKRSPSGGGLQITLSFLKCGHKGARAGAQMRGHMPWRCASCVKKEAASATA